MAASKAAADRARSSHSFLLLPNSFGTRLNMLGYKTVQVSVDGMSLFWETSFKWAEWQLLMVL